jgi:AcrR family transcriptional regulator
MKMRKLVEGKAETDESARGKLISAGIEVFGEYGFDGATTRMISSRAGVNLAAIPYYFGSKKELYRAVVEQIIIYAMESVKPLLDRINAELADRNLPRKRLLELLMEQLSLYVNLTLTSDMRHFDFFILREQIRPSEAFSVFYNKITKYEHSTCTEIVARLTGVSPDSDEAMIRAHSVLGEVAVFFAIRETILRRLGRKEFTEKDIETVRHVIMGNIQAQFGGRGNCSRIADS